MNAFTLIIDGPLTPRAQAEAANLARAAHAPSAPGTIGATLRFEGIVRRAEADPQRGGQPHALLALDYQTYDPMALRELQTLALNIAHRHGLTSITALHSRGRVNVGEVSFILEVTAPHRAETLNAVTEFIDLLKQDVPIWKRAVWE